MSRFLAPLGLLPLLICSAAASLRAQTDTVPVVPLAALAVQPTRLNKPQMNYGRGGPAEVVLTYVIDTSGAVESRSVHIISATDTGYAHAASTFVRQMLFSPSRYDDAPVRVLIEQRIAFSWDMKTKSH